MFAEVVVLRNAQNIDRLFTYSVPENFGNRVEIGSRVLVPFGASGYLEAVIVSLLSETSLESEIKIKAIHYVFNDGIYLTSKDVLCALKIKEDTLCSYSEAVQLFLPFNTMIKQIKTYQLNPSAAIEVSNVKKNEANVLKALSEGALKYEELCIDLKDSVKNIAINRLLALGYIDLTYSYEQNVKDRTVTWVHVIGDLLTYRETIPKRNTAELKLLDFLIENPVHKRLSIQEQLKISKSLIDRLVERQLIEIVEKDELRMPIFMKSHEDKSQVVLNDEQQIVFSDIIRQYESGEGRDFLVHGITGSGKTELYAELIQYVIKKGKKAVLVVPEISLTPQITARFASRFGDEKIALIHSKISQGERYDQWKGIRRGDYDIIIGARSAVFAPSDDIGIIIIDECHENSYRSEKRPKYQTYDVAKLRMNLLEGLLISGSATPNITDYYETQTGKRKLYKLQKRHNLMQLPEVQIVDMRQELINGNKSILSHALYQGIVERLEKKEQVIVFLNRKGHSTFVSCRSCGFTLACPNCDVTLTYFKGEKSVKCNYCQYETYVPKKCPKCESQYFKYFGVGTEKVEEELGRLFPTARIARMDKTTTSKKGSIEQIISEVEAEEIDILIGTQMVAKGLDFKHVTLIGILSADLILNLPQYQASERAYQLFTQVAGRAGRGSVSGEVILQTYNPDHYAINQPNFEQFYQNEIRYRQALKYPPFYRLINLVFTAQTSEVAGKYAQKSFDFLRNNLLKKDLQNLVEIYPANPALLKKLDNQYRWQIIIKCKPEAYEPLKDLIRDLESKFTEIKTCKINIDLDATNVL